MSGRPPQCRVIRFAQVRAVAADAIEMRARFQPGALHYRLVRTGGATNDIGAADGDGEIIRRLDRDTWQIS
jgi:hypothetical protein